MSFGFSSLKVFMVVLLLGLSLSYSQSAPSSSGFCAINKSQIGIYFAGESIEQRVRYTSAPFASNGSLNLPTNNDNNQYGWVVPLVDKLSAANPGKSFVFVGSGLWQSADGFAYSGTYPSTTARNTSAVSGMSTDDWITNHRSELTSKRFCYDIAFVTRGGNDGWMDDATLTNYIIDAARLVSSGSSCNSNPTVYVVSHLPADRITIARGTARYSNTAKSAVNTLKSQNSSMDVRLIDVFGAFVNNTPTQAFPNPSWKSSNTSLNYSKIQRTGDAGHVRRLPSIYAGEIAASAVSLTTICTSPLNNSTTTPPVCSLSCTSPQLLNSTSCSCYTPVVTPPACTLSCTSPQVLNSTSCSCYTPLVCGGLSCTSPQLLNSTSCSCYTPVTIPPVNNSTTTPPTTAQSMPPLPVSGNYVGQLRTVDVSSETTLRLAINSALPGDVIRIAPGNYVFLTQLWIEAKGTSANPIYIVANGPRGSVRISTPSSEGFNVGGAAQYLVFEDLEIFNAGNNIFHIQDGSHHITLRNLNLHHAGFDGDVIKVNQANNILIEGSDLSYPGSRSSGENPAQEVIDFVDSDNSVVRLNFIHHFGNIGLYAKGGSVNALFENNVVALQSSSAVEPALGVGGWTDSNLLNGAQYEISGMIVKNNFIYGNSFGGVGIYDAFNSVLYKNILMNNDRAILQFRAGNAPLATSSNFNFSSNYVLDNRGSLPSVCQVSSHGLTGFVASSNNYWNNLNSIPTSADCNGFIASAESGATVSNINIASIDLTSYSSAIRLVNYTYSIPVSTPPLNNSTTTPPACTLSCTSPQVLNSTSCSCYTPLVCGGLTCTSPQLLNSTICSCYTPVTIPPVNNSTTTPPTTSTLRVYVSGESIEQRNRFLSAPFTSSGTLSSSTPSDLEYGWMVPFADRLKLRSPGLAVQFVGSGRWTGADDSAYSGTYPSSTAQATSAVSGMSTDDWIAGHRSELTSRTYCYDIALITRGGNDGWMSVTDRKDYIKQVATLVAAGSSCNPNPIVYVTSHMPDQFGSGDESAAYRDAPRDAVSELAMSNVKFVDVYGAFDTNLRTTAFPSPTWKSGSSFNYASILLSGDQGHPSKLSSIYVGEVVANAIVLSGLGSTTPPLNNSTTTPPVCSLTCTSPQLLNSTSCSCYTPVVTPPACTLSCTSPQVLNSTSCSCYTPLVCGGLTCTSPQLLNSTSCSCYTPVTTPPANTTAGAYSSMPIVPTINSQMKTYLRTILASGASLGNRPSVFAKVGDSITESGSFLTDIGCGGTDQFGSYTSLIPTANYFMSTSLGAAPVWCGTGNSYTRASMAAVMGWTTSSVLSSTSSCAAPYNSYLRCEIQTIKPSIALVMYGTNDLQSPNNPTQFRTNLRTIVDTLVSDGVIPVLSTIPPRLDTVDGVAMGPRVATYNQIIADVAAEKNVPLWNYWAQLQGSSMINQGVSSDGIHPSVYNGADGAVLTSTGLRYGYNQRNLGAIQVLDKLKTVVIDNGSPDP